MREPQNPIAANNISRGRGGLRAISRPIQNEPSRLAIKSDSAALTTDGWFDTGDIATIDADGYMHITDRAKDVIKSGGEWISSVDLENAALGHPQIAHAAVIGIRHPKWLERPYLICVARGAQKPSLQEVNAYLETKVPKWWLPDGIAFVDAIPLGPTGKIQKTKLREQFKDVIAGK